MRLRTRRGFALPMAIFVIAILTVAVTASFLSAGGERRVVDSQQAQARAYNAAQAGLERYVSDRVAVLAAQGQSVNGAPGAFELSTETVDKPLTIPAGVSGEVATIRVHKVRNAVGVMGTAGYQPETYVVRATASDAQARLTGMQAASRTVGQLVIWQPTDLQVLAGWTSLSGLRKNGNSGTLSGVDKCGAQVAVAGVAVPDGGYSGPTTPVSGTPPIKYLGDAAATNAAVKINWNEVKNNNAIPADYTNQWPPSSAYNNVNFWPVVHFTGDAVLQSGRGMLIVDGNLRMNGSVTWDGIVMVGENITSNGNNTVYGAVVTGLDRKLGEDNILSSDVGNGTKIFQYHSCNVARSTASIGTLRPLNNTWSDSWKF